MNKPPVLFALFLLAIILLSVKLSHIKDQNITPEAIVPVSNLSQEDLDADVPELKEKLSSCLLHQQVHKIVCVDAVNSGIKSVSQYLEECSDWIDNLQNMNGDFDDKAILKDSNVNTHSPRCEELKNALMIKLRQSAIK